MRIVIQRVTEASVTIDGQVHSTIGPGMMVLVGVREGDTLDDMRWLAQKTVNLRIFDDEQGVMNRSIIELLATTWPCRSTKPTATRWLNCWERRPSAACSAPRCRWHSSTTAPSPSSSTRDLRSES